MIKVISFSNNDIEQYKNVKRAMCAPIHRDIDLVQVKCTSDLNMRQISRY